MTIKFKPPTKFSVKVRKLPICKMATISFRAKKGGGYQRREKFAKALCFGE